MSMLGQVAWVLAAFVAVGAATVTVAMRRRPAAPGLSQPRTVADLVRMRAETAATDVDSAAATAVAPDAAAPSHVAVVGSDAVVTEDAVEVAVTTDPDSDTAPDADDTEPPRSPAAAAPSIPVPYPLGDTGDTPWGRAAWMAEGVRADRASSAEGPSGERLPAAGHGPDATAGCSAPADTGAAPAPPAPPTSSPRARPPSAETPSAGAVEDLALLRTFGFLEPRRRPDGPPVGADGPAREDAVARRVGFRVVGRDGVGVAGTTVTLLDDRGQGSFGVTPDADGSGEAWAVRPGRYVLVCTAPGHQPGAVAITVGDAPTEAEVLLARSGSLAGCVHDEDGPIPEARLTLVQGGEIVDVVDSGAGGAYRIADLAAGDYTLTVTAADHEPVAALLHVPDGTGLRHDVALGPAGSPSGHDAEVVDDDLVIGHR